MKSSVARKSDNPAKTSRASKVKPPRSRPRPKMYSAGTDVHELPLPPPPPSPVGSTEEHDTDAYTDEDSSRLKNPQNTTSKGKGVGVRSTEGNDTDAYRDDEDSSRLKNPQNTTSKGKGVGVRSTEGNDTDAYRDDEDSSRLKNPQNATAKGKGVGSTEGNDTDAYRDDEDSSRRKNTQNATAKGKGFGSTEGNDTDAYTDDEDSSRLKNPQNATAKGKGVGGTEGNDTDAYTDEDSSRLKNPQNPRTTPRSNGRYAQEYQAARLWDDDAGLQKLEQHDHALIKKTRKVLEHRHHSFRGIWGGVGGGISQTGSGDLSPMKGKGFGFGFGQLKMAMDQQRQSCLPPGPCFAAEAARGGRGSVSWRQWPPQVPLVPDGLKIPVMEFAGEGGYTHSVPQNLNLPLDHHGHHRLDACTGIQFLPVDEGPEELFTNLRGMLNRPEALTCTVSPSPVLFLNSKVGDRFAVTVRVQNKSSIPQKFGVLRPANKYLDVTWGVELGEGTMIPPGLSARVVIEFQPKSTESIADLLTIIVHGDGNIVVPVIATSISPPVLEVEEWDCGCSVVGQARVSEFEISNFGGAGRFWLVTEEQFNGLHFGDGANARGQNEEEDEFYTDEEQECEFIGEGGEFVNPYLDSNQKKQSSQRLKGHLSKKPFKIFPAAFRLAQDQKIRIKTKYRPTAPGFHFEKLGVLCDNSEVRWIAVKGIGLDAEKEPILTVEGEWSGPPCDLPTDIGTKLAIDCGDLLPSQIGKPGLKLTNKSCIPVYFFWSIRPLHVGPAALRKGATTSESTNMATYAEASRSEFVWTDHYEEPAPGGVDPCGGGDVRHMQIQIHPAQGVLEPFQNLDAHLIVEAPALKHKFHSCVVSLFVQQLENVEIKRRLVQNDSLLSPSFELEVWARSVPLDCYFDPPLFLATGNPSQRLERVFACVNQSGYKIKIKWNEAGFLDGYCSMIVEPAEFEVEPDSRHEFRVQATLFKPEKVCQELCGQVTIEYPDFRPSRTPAPIACSQLQPTCKIPVSLDIYGHYGASIETLTPVIHFGVLAQGTEAVRTLALKNTGAYKVTWHASLDDLESDPEALADVVGGGHSMGMALALAMQQKQKQKRVLKIWPEWGALDPGEVAGAQLFLNAGIGDSKIASIVEITIDQNPDFASRLYIPVFAKVQALRNFKNL